MTAPRPRERFIDADLLDREECLRAFGEDVRTVGSGCCVAELLEDAARYDRRRKPVITTYTEGDCHHE
jgi:hypothetical protein